MQITHKKPIFERIDLCDLPATQKLFETHPDTKGVIHFAALKSVPESVEQPLRYYQNNLNSLLNVMNSMAEYQIPNFIFSSSCSVYGNAEVLPVTEQTPMGYAESLYASSKQMGERMIQDFIQSTTGIKAILLRYFNPGGAHPTGLMGEISGIHVPRSLPNQRLFPTSL